MSEELATHYRAKRLSFSTLDSGDDGTLVLRDTVLLAAGEWHDSITPYQTVYTPENLSKFSVVDGQSSVAGFREHGSSHTMDDEIGDAVNIHYDAAQQAIVCDLILHGATQASRDIIGIIRKNQKQHKPNYVSIEMLTRDIPDESGKMMATDILVTGWIATTTPACKRCAIKQQNAATTMTDEQKKELESEVPAAPVAEETKELECKTEKQEEAPGKESGNVGEVNPEPKDEPKDEKPAEDESGAIAKRIDALEARFDELMAKLEGQKDFDKRLSALEKAPAGKVMHMQTASVEPLFEPIVEYKTRYF